MFTKNRTTYLFVYSTTNKYAVRFTVLDPTYERRTNTENRIGPNLWLLTNNRRDAACVRRCVSRVKHSKLILGRNHPLLSSQHLILATFCDFVNTTLK